MLSSGVRSTRGRPRAWHTTPLKGRGRWPSKGDVAVKLIARLLRRPQTFRRIIAVVSRFVHDTTHSPRHVILIAEGCAHRAKESEQIDHIAKITVPDTSLRNMLSCAASPTDPGPIAGRTAEPGPRAARRCCCESAAVRCDHVFTSMTSHKALQRRIAGRPRNCLASRPAYR
jgi:hypothetical protein